MSKAIRIIGAGLAGSEAAWQCARRGLAVELYEMRPGALDARAPDVELRRTGLLQFAEVRHREHRAVAAEGRNAPRRIAADGNRRARPPFPPVTRWPSIATSFAEAVTAAIEREPLIRVVREEVTAIDESDGITIIATGPLTSDALRARFCGSAAAQQLYFYDSISPIVEADSIDMSRVYMAARYDKGTADYINCPMTRKSTTAFSTRCSRRNRSTPRTGRT